jgi:hypothetical protein
MHNFNLLMMWCVCNILQSRYRFHSRPVAEHLIEMDTKILLPNDLSQARARDGYGFGA